MFRLRAACSNLCAPDALIAYVCGQNDAQPANKPSFFFKTPLPGCRGVWHVSLCPLSQMNSASFGA
eukprot:6506264-Prymnesium_polylepis.1